MIEAIKNGDEFAFEQAYILFRQKHYNYFLKKTQSAEDAGDLMQTTFMKLWKYRGSLSTDYELEQQIFYIGRNVFIDYLRKENRKAEARRQELKKQETEFFPSKEFDAGMALNTALSALPEIRKKVFILNRLQGYSYREIADMLSISVKAVDNNLTKALRQLRKMFLFLLIMLLSSIL